MAVAGEIYRTLIRPSGPREPHETPWLSEYRRGCLDGVLAAQCYRIVTIEPPPGVCR